MAGRERPSPERNSCSGGAGPAAEGEEIFAAAEPSLAARPESDGDIPAVRRVAFPPLPEASPAPVRHGIPPAFHKIALTVSAELGKTTIKVRDLINLQPGSILQLDRLADESVTVLVNEAPFAQGEVVVINDRFAVRMLSFTGETEEP